VVTALVSQRLDNLVQSVVPLATIKDDSGDSLQGWVGELSWWSRWHSLAEKPLVTCFFGLPAFFGSGCVGPTVVGMVLATVFGIV
jgi:hypothetical protein